MRAEIELRGNALSSSPLVGQEPRGRGRPDSYPSAYCLVALSTRRRGKTNTRPTFTPLDLYGVLTARPTNLRRQSQRSEAT
jgi:hypothetical protein